MNSMPTTHIEDSDRNDAIRELAGGAEPLTSEAAAEAEFRPHFYRRAMSHFFSGYARDEAGSDGLSG